MNPIIFANLRNVLAKLIPDEPSIRRIVDDSGLDRWKIDFSSSVINIWHSVLIEAEKLDRVEALLGVVEGEYGSNQEFLTACTAYRQLAGKTGPSNLDPRMFRNEQRIQGKPRRQRLLILLLGVLLFSGVAGGG